MSALQIDNRQSDADARYGLAADVRARRRARRSRHHHVMTVLVRTTVGVLTAIAVAILVAGVATQNAFGIVGGGLATIMLTTALICMSSVPEKLFNR